jgi:hypothetical protein
MKSLGDYYDVYFHNFTLAQAFSSLTADGATTTPIALTFSPLGSVTAGVAYVPNLGCVEVSDNFEYPCMAHATCPKSLKSSSCNLSLYICSNRMLCCALHM